MTIDEATNKIQTAILRNDPEDAAVAALFLVAEVVKDLKRIADAIEHANDIALSK